MEICLSANEKVLYRTKRSPLCVVGIILLLYFLSAGIYFLFLHVGKIEFIILGFIDFYICCIIIWQFLHLIYDKMVITDKGIHWVEMTDVYFVDWKDVKKCCFEEAFYKSRYSGWQTYLTIVRHKNKNMRVNLTYVKDDLKQITETINGVIQQMNMNKKTPMRMELVDCDEIYKNRRFF